MLCTILLEQTLGTLSKSKMWVWMIWLDQKLKWELMAWMALQNCFWIVTIGDSVGLPLFLSGQGIEGTLPSSRQISVAERADLLFVLSAMCSMNSASPTLPDMNRNALGKGVETGGLKCLKLLVAGKMHVKSSTNLFAIFRTRKVFKEEIIFDHQSLML